MVNIYIYINIYIYTPYMDPMGYMVYTSLTPKRGLFHKLVNPLNHHQEDETK